MKLPDPAAREGDQADADALFLAGETVVDGPTSPLTSTWREPERLGTYTMSDTHGSSGPLVPGPGNGGNSNSMSRWSLAV